MKYKYNLALLAIVSMFIFMALSSAAITLQSPAASTNWTTTVNLNCTNTADSIDKALNATFYYNSSGGATGTANALTTLTNDSADDIEFYSASVSITSLADSATYNWTCLVANASTNLQSAGKAGITMEDAAPTCTTGASLLQRKNLEQGMTQVLTCSCTDTIDSAPTHTRTLTQPGSTTVSISSSPYTTTGGDVRKMGLYTFSCSAQDYAGNTDTDTNTFRVDTDDQTNPITTIIPDTQTKTSNTTILMLAGGLVLLIAIIAVFIALLGRK